MTLFLYGLFSGFVAHYATRLKGFRSFDKQLASFLGLIGGIITVSLIETFNKQPLEWWLNGILAALGGMVLLLIVKRRRKD